MIRLLAYNLSGGLVEDALVDVLTSLAPDVACVVETPGRRGLRRIARRAGLQVAARAHRRNLANAVLVGDRARALSTNTIVLPTVPGAPNRVAAHAIVGVGSVRLSVVACQLGLHPDNRSMRAAELERFIATIDATTVLGGDLNEPPGGAVARRFSEVLDDAFAVAGEGRGETYPTPDPTARHDYLFVGRELDLVRCWVPSDPPVDVASHHRPVVAELATSETELDRTALRREERREQTEARESAA